MCLRFLKRQLSRNEARSPTKIEPDNVVTHLIAPFPPPAAESKRVGSVLNSAQSLLGTVRARALACCFSGSTSWPAARRKPSQMFIISSLTACAVFRQKAAERRAVGSTPT